MFSIALAEGVKTAPAPSLVSNLVFFGFFFVVIYFFVIRPHYKKSKQEKQMRESIRIGDKIVTISGVFGSVVEIDDTKGVISIEISKGVNILIYKTSIAEVLTKKDDESSAKQQSKK